MNLEQFAKEAGVSIVNVEPGWGGRYGYTTKDEPNSTTCGFRSHKTAYQAWLANTFGRAIAKALLKLLPGEE